MDMFLTNSSNNMQPLPDFLLQKKRKFFEQYMTGISEILYCTIKNVFFLARIDTQLIKIEDHI